MKGLSCEANRKTPCLNKPYRVLDVYWRARWLASYWFCRKHYALVAGDGEGFVPK